MGYSKPGAPTDLPKNINQDLVDILFDTLSDVAWLEISDILEQVDGVEARRTVNKYLRMMKQAGVAESLYFNSEKRLWRLKTSREDSNQKDGDSVSD